MCPAWPAVELLSLKRLNMYRKLRKTRAALSEGFQELQHTFLVVWPSFLNKFIYFWDFQPKWDFVLKWCPTNESGQQDHAPTTPLNLYMEPESSWRKVSNSHVHGTCHRKEVHWYLLVFVFQEPKTIMKIGRWLKGSYGLGTLLEQLKLQYCLESEAVDEKLWSKTELNNGKELTHIQIMKGRDSYDT